MAIKFTKKTEQVEVLNQPELSDYAAEIVMLGEIQDQMEELRKIIADKAADELQACAELEKEFKKKLDKLRATLDKQYADEPADSTFVENGIGYVAQVGKKGNQRKVTDIRLIHEIMGDDVFYKLAKMDLKDIDDYLTPDERVAVLEDGFTKRSVTIERVKRISLG